MRTQQGMVCCGMKIHPDWFDNSELLTLMRCLNYSDQSTVFVGGCVRDFFLKRPVVDIDCATQLQPEQVMERAKKAGFKAIATGLQHGTVTVILSDRSVEVTTLRRDIATDGRRAVIAFTKDWHEDAQRRDFTINALYLTADGVVMDPLGIGLSDIKEGRLRFVGNAQARIQEDALRILRYFRFLHLFPQKNIDNNALQACLQYQHLLGNLSKERRAQELFQLLMQPSPYMGLDVMASHAMRMCGMSFHIQPFKACTAMQDRYQVPCLMARLMAIAGDMDLEDIQHIVQLSRKQSQSWRTIASLKAVSHDPLALYFAAYKNGHQEAVQAAILSGWSEEALHQLVHWTAPTCSITADSVMREEGLSPGKALGDRLRQLEEEWFKGMVDPILK